MTRKWLAAWLQMALVFVIALGVAACVWRTEHKIETVSKIDAHIVLDIRQIRADSSQVEDYVRGGGAPPAVTPAPAAPAGKPTSMAPRRSLWALLDPAATAWAADEIRSEPPPSAAEEKAAIEARKARFKAIDALLVKGVIGENDRGYIEGLGEAKKDKKLEPAIKEENKDRRTIYRAILARRGGKSADLPIVETVNAEAIRDKLKAGQSFQAPRDKEAFAQFAQSKLGKLYPDAKPGAWLKKK